MKRFIFIFTILICVLLLCSCSTSSVPKDSQLIEDLSAQDQFVFGGTVSDIEIIKRLTDEEAKTDTVYVTATIDHPNHTTHNSFVMEYVLYNDGWLIEAVDMYYGNESVYEVIPKAPPTDEEIMAEMEIYSHGDLQYYSTPLLEEYGLLYDDRCIDSVFFEEGSYTYEIDGGVFYESYFDATIVIHRQFEYSKVTETGSISMYFDDQLDRWCRSGYNITDLQAEYDLAGLWYAETSSGLEQIVVRTMELDSNPLDDIPKVHDKIHYTWKDVNDSSSILRPNSKLLLSSNVYCNTFSHDLNFNLYTIDIIVSPDGIFVYDEGLGDFIPMTRE